MLWICYWTSLFSLFLFILQQVTSFWRLWQRMYARQNYVTTFQHTPVTRLNERTKTPKRLPCVESAALIRYLTVIKLWQSYHPNFQCYEHCDCPHCFLSFSYHRYRVSSVQGDCCHQFPGALHTPRHPSFHNGTFIPLVLFASTFYVTPFSHYLLIYCSMHW